MLHVSVRTLYRAFAGEETSLVPTDAGHFVGAYKKHFGETSNVSNVRRRRVGRERRTHRRDARTEGMTLGCHAIGTRIPLTAADRPSSR
ncbi:hypothetical protein [Streptomyces sp. NPDC056987]|uniref:hypothetical protein n=1 Tax=Streptomyces sp. NPDC056987 TaxID=3345988 RepID=UPI00363CFEE5